MLNDISGQMTMGNGMDDSSIGDESIIGTMTFVKAKTVIPKRSLVVGSFGKIVKMVSNKMIA